MFAGISYIYISTPVFPFDRWIHISKCLLITSTWMSQWNYNLAMSKTKFSFLHNSAPFPVFSFSVNGPTFLHFYSPELYNPSLRLSCLPDPQQTHQQILSIFSLQCLSSHLCSSSLPSWAKLPLLLPAFISAMVPCFPKSHLILSNLFFTL